MTERKVGSGFGVILSKGEEVLMGRRHEDPIKADSAFGSAAEWTLPGGKLNWQESFEDGAVREVREETGVEIKNPEVISVHNCKNDQAHFITIGLIATQWEGEPQIMEPDEITEWGWFNINELPSPIYFPSKEVLENYQTGKFYIKRD